MAVSWSVRKIGSIPVIDRPSNGRPLSICERCSTTSRQVAVIQQTASKKASTTSEPIHKSLIRLIRFR